MEAKGDAASAEKKVSAKKRKHSGSSSDEGSGSSQVGKKRPATTYTACKSMDGSEIGKVLTSVPSGSFVHAESHGNKTPLHIAAEQGDISSAQSLAKQLQDVNTKDRNGDTPLHLAAKCRPKLISDEKIILYDRQDKASVKSRWGQRCRNVRVDEDDRKIVEILIENGADVNACNSWHLTPLHYAAASGIIDMIKLLLDRGADPNGCSCADSNRKSFMHSSHISKGTFVHHLNAGMNHNVEVIDGDTPLHCAATCGEIEVINLLLKYNADRYIRNSFGETILHRASKQGHLKIVEAFLENFAVIGKDFDQRSTECKSVKVDTECGQFEIDVGLDMAQAHILDVDDIFSLLSESTDGNKQIEISNYRNNENIATILLKRNIIQKLITRDGETALHSVAKHLQTQKDVEHLETLLVSGAFDVNALNTSNETPLHVICALLNYTSTQVAEKEKALVNKGVQLLVANNANVNHKNYVGKTPLMWAAERGYSHILDLLQSPNENAGTHVDKDIHGETALMKASRKQHFEVVKLLVEKGTNVHLRDDRGFTALHSAFYQGSCANFSSDNYLPRNHGNAIKTFTQLLTGSCASFRNENYLSDNNRNDITIFKRLLEACPAAKDEKDFCGNTAFDLWMKYAPDISTNTKDTFLQHGCALHTLRGMEQLSGFPMFEPEKRKIIYRFLQLHFVPNPELLSETEVKCLTANPVIYKLSLFLRTPLLINTNTEDFLIMAKNDDKMKRTILHHEVMTERVFHDADIRLSERVEIIKSFMVYGCDVNAVDFLQRTPLHYADSRVIADLLLENGANKDAKDIYGYRAEDLFKIRLKNKTIRLQIRNKSQKWGFELRLKEALEQQIKKWTIPSYRILKSIRVRKRRQALGHAAEQSTDSYVWTIWDKERYPYRHRATSMITEKVTQFMYKLAEGIKSRDSRFECETRVVGSVFEGTKINQPDEFDFSFSLTKLNKCCKVVELQHAGAPSGYVHLMKATDSSRPTEFQSDGIFDDLFNSDGYLRCGEVIYRFKMLLYRTLVTLPISDDDLFEWDVLRDIFDSSKKVDGPQRVCMTVHLYMTRPVEGLILDNIAVDIVPCIRIDGWWPKAAISDVREDLKAEGCYVLFDQPQFKYRKVPLTYPYARITFGLAESTRIKECPPTWKAAYMVAKQVIYPNSTYPLKTALLYCIEALNSNARINEIESYDDMTKEELEFAVRKLMWCYLEFYRKICFPSYFMPSFVVVGYDSDKLLHISMGSKESDDSRFVSVMAHYSQVIQGYLLLCQEETEADFHFPISPFPCVQFDRKSFLERMAETPTSASKILSHEEIYEIVHKIKTFKTICRLPEMKITNCMFDKCMLEVCYLLEGNASYDENEICQKLSTHLSYDRRSITLTRLKAEPIYKKTLGPGEPYYSVNYIHVSCTVGAMVSVGDQGIHALIPGHGQNENTMVHSHGTGTPIGTVNVVRYESVVQNNMPIQCDVALARLQNPSDYVAYVMMQGVPVGLEEDPIDHEPGMRVKRYTSDDRGGVAHTFVNFESDEYYISVTGSDGEPIHVAGESGTLIVKYDGPPRDRAAAVGMLTATVSQQLADGSTRSKSLAVRLANNFTELQRSPYCNGATIRFAQP